MTEGNSQIERERAVKNAIRAILSHPALAEETFPDPVIRANILPLLESLEIPIASARKEK